LWQPFADFKATTYVRMRSLDMSAAVRKQEKEKMDCVIEKYQLYIRGDITRSQYIRCVAYKWLLTDFVCLYNYEFGLSLCKIVRSSVILLLPLYNNR
jgi:hypothetical protein